MREVIYGKDQRVNRHRFDGVDPVILYPFKLHMFLIDVLSQCKAHSNRHAFQVTGGTLVWLTLLILILSVG